MEETKDLRQAVIKNIGTFRILPEWNVEVLKKSKVKKFGKVSLKTVRESSKKDLMYLCKSLSRLLCKKHKHQKSED